MSRVKHIDLVRAPGIRKARRLQNLDPGLVVLVGRNASGKSTIGRAIGHALWGKGAPSEMVATIDLEQDDGAKASATISAGQVSWSPAPVAVPDAAAGAWRMTVGELLQHKGGSDQDIASQIERELTGGFDLRAARDAFGAPSRPGRRTTQHKTRDDAQRALRKALDDAADLARREEQLDLLKRRSKEAQEAHERLSVARTALARADKVAEVARLKVQLDAFDPVLAVFPEDADKQVAQAREALRKQADAVGKAQKRVEDLERELAGIDFAGAVPNKVDVDACVLRGSDLVELARQERRLAAEVDAAHKSFRETSNAVFDGAGPTAALDAAALDALSQALQEVRDKGAAHAAAEQYLEDQPPADSELEQLNADELRAGCATLRRWLSAEQPGEEVEEASVAGLVVALLAAVLCAVLATIIAAVAGQMSVVVFALVAALLVGAVAWALWRRSKDSPAAKRWEVARLHRQRIAREWPATLQSPPWDPQGVQVRLSELEQTLAAKLADEHHQTEWDRAQRLLVRAQREHDAAMTHLQSTVEQLGVGGGFADLALARQAQLLADVDEAARTANSRQQELQHLAQQRQALADQLLRWITQVNGAPVADPSPQALAAGVADIQQRQTRRLELLADIGRANEDFGAAQDAQEDASIALTSLWEALEVEPADDLAIAERLAALPEHKRVRKQHSAAVAEVARLGDAIGDDPLKDETAEMLRDEIARLTAVADEAEARADALAELKAELNQAADATTVADLRQAVMAADEQLYVQRDDLAQRNVGAALVDWLSAEVARDQTPDVLRRARGLLGRFTHGRYRLDVGPDRKFIAHDTEQDAVRKLSELSDGTRIQTLLAARLAYLEHAEDGGEKLPLFLDEALSTTDPHRFVELAGCLLELVRDGRQVIYATADTSEAQAFARVWAEAGEGQPGIVDVDAVLGGEPAWPDELPVEPMSAAPVPAPQGGDAVAYLRQLGVQPPSLWQPVGSWHLALALADDLAAAHRCLVAGFTTVGPLLELAGMGAAVPLDVGQVEGVRRWAALVGACLEALRVGRHRSVPWREVEASGAITGAFRERVQGIWDRQRDDAEAFVSEVAALPRMQAKRVDKLREHLESVGVWDPRQAFGEDEAAAQVVSALTTSDQQNAPTLAEARGMLRWLGMVVGG